MNRVFWFLCAIVLVLSAGSCDLLTGGGGKVEQYVFTSFKFEAVNNPLLTVDVECDITDTRFISGQLPDSADISNLVPTFTVAKGRVLVNGVPQISGQTAQNFAQPVEYRIIDTGFNIGITVTLTQNVILKMTSFTFLKEKNPHLEKDYIGAINQDNSSITFVIPATEDISALIPTFEHEGDDTLDVTGSAFINSGVETFDFTSFKIFSVYSRRTGVDNRSYTINVNPDINGSVYVSEKTLLDKISSYDVLDVAVDNGVIYVATNFGLSISEDNGTTWRTMLPDHSINSIVAKGNLLCALGNFKIFVSEDNGSNWTSTQKQVRGYSNNNAFSNNGEIWVLTYNGVIVSEDNGSTFETKTQFDKVYSINVTSGGRIYLGAWDAIHYSDDNGETWKTAKSEQLQEYHYVFEDNGNLFLGDDSIYRFDNNGSSVLLPTAIKYLAKVSNIVKVGTTLIAGYSGGIAVSEDNGSTWNTKIVSSTLSQQNNIRKLASHGGVIYAATGGGLMVSSDSGDTWQNLNKRLEFFARSVSDLKPYRDKVYIASQYDGLQIYDMTSKNWTSYISEDFGMSASVLDIAVNDSMICLVVNQKEILYSTDNGTTWGNSTIPLTGKSAIVNDLKVDGTVIYVAADEGLFKSSDFGTNWETLYASEVYSCLVIDNNEVFFGSNAGLLRYTPGAIPWNPFAASYTDQSSVSRVGKTSDGFLYFVTANNVYLNTFGLDVRKIGTNGYSNSLSSRVFLTHSSGRLVLKYMAENKEGEKFLSFKDYFQLGLSDGDEIVLLGYRVYDSKIYAVLKNIGLVILDY